MPEAARDGTLLGLDYGARRLGIAVGSRRSGSAQPLSTLAVRDGAPDWSVLDRLVDEWRPVGLVLGLPYNLDGTDHALRPTVEALAAELVARYELPVELVDERLTSSEAEAELRAARASGQRRRRVDKEAVDALAAALILQGYLAEATD